MPYSREEIHNGAHGSGLEAVPTPVPTSPVAPIQGLMVALVLGLLLWGLSALAWWML